MYFLSLLLEEDGGRWQCIISQNENVWIHIWPDVSNLFVLSGAGIFAYKLLYVTSPCSAETHF